MDDAKHSRLPPAPIREASEEDRRALAVMLMGLFKHWQLSTVEQLDALGLPITSRATLARYRHGKPLAGDRDTLDRAANLLSIHKSLRLMFPRNLELAYQWMKLRNRAFDGMPPIDVIRTHGFAGLLMVRSYLNRYAASQLEETTTPSRGATLN